MTMAYRRGDPGFSMIELLVVVLIIAILSAVAVPAYVKQRNKALVAQSLQGLKDAATSAEGYALEQRGDYSGITSTFLRAQGYRGAPDVVIDVVGNTLGYCLRATHSDLDAANEWTIATWDSDRPGSSTSDNCPDAPTF